MPRQKKVDGEKLIGATADAILTGGSFRSAARELSPKDQDKLCRALGMTVEKFRTEFADQLRAGASEALTLLRQKLDLLKPGELAFALSVLTDKANALESRGSTLAPNISQQVNNFYLTDKATLLATLQGKRPPQTVQPVEPTQPDDEKPL